MITIGIPETTSYFWRQRRRTTYNNWPFNESDKCNAERMAAAGFYVVGDNNEPDLVECFICGKQLNGWEPDDDPWDEHVKHKSDCPFVILNKQDEKKWTVDELYNLYKTYKTKEYTNEVEKYVAKLKDVATQLMSELAVCRTTQESKTSTD